MNLRPYQAEQIKLLREGFIKHKRQLLCSATGSGKTVVFSEIARLAAEKNKCVWIVCDRIELVMQSLNKLNAHDVQVITANTKKYKPAMLNIAMVETLYRRLKSGINITPADLIIIDEAHKKTFNKLIDLYPDTKILGCTATPIGKQLFGIYTNMVQNIDIPDLIEQGFLCKSRTFQMQDDLSDIRIVAGEYEERSLFDHYAKVKLYAGVIREYKAKANNTKALCFCVNVEHAQQMTDAFNADGICAKLVTGSTPDEDRKRLFDGFEKGYFNILVGVNVFTTGFDAPSVQTIIMNRATLSKILFLQCVGRGARIFKDKPYFTLLDFGLNVTRHGLYEQPREWKLEPPKSKNKIGVAPVKDCIQCEAVVPASARVCPYCQYEFPVSDAVPKEGVMVEVTLQSQSKLVGRRIGSLSISELIELESQKKYKPSMIWRVCRSHGADAVREYAHKKSYKAGWIHRQLADLDNSNFNDYVIR